MSSRQDARQSVPSIGVPCARARHPCALGFEGPDAEADAPGLQVLDAVCGRPFALPGCVPAQAQVRRIRRFQDIQVVGRDTDGRTRALPARRQGRGIHVRRIRRILRRTRHRTTAFRPQQAPAERRRRAHQPHACRRRHSDAGRVRTPSDVLGGGCSLTGARPQPLLHLCVSGRDALRAVAWTEAGRLAPARLGLHCVCARPEGQTTGAVSSHGEMHLYWLSGRLQGLEILQPSHEACSHL